MLPDLPAQMCTECHASAHLVAWTRHYRRAGHVLSVETGMWECASCADPFTREVPFRFADPPLMRWTDARAAELWLERFDEPMPASERGKHKAPHRTVRVPVMLTPAEAARLDEVRGGQTRSDFLRGAIRRTG